MTEAAAGCVVGSHDGGVHVWSNSLVNLGEAQKEESFCTVTVPCFKAQVSDTSLGRCYTCK